MSRAARFVAGSVVRVVWARSIRGLVVLLLGGVIITLVVRAVEGKSARDPVTLPPSPQVASGDSSGTGSLDGTPVAMAPRRGGASGEPEATASYVARIPQGTATYADVDAAFLRYDGLWTWFKVPSLHDSGPVAVRARDFLKQPRAWGRVAIPADIQRALGDAEVYVMVGGGNARMMRGVRANRFYDLPREINQFSLDGGLRCGPDNADLFVRVYTFFMAAYERLRLDVSFKEDRFTGITPARVDSLLNGAIPLVSAYRVRILSVLVSSDKGPGVELSTYRGSVGRIRAVVDWGDRLDSTKAEFASVHGFPGMSFPEYWDWGTEVRPWGLLLDSPHAPESRGGLDPVYFKIDDDNSYGVRIVTSGSPGGHVDSAAYAVVRDIASGTGITPPPRYEFRVMNVPPVGRPCTYVRGKLGKLGTQY